MSEIQYPRRWVNVESIAEGRITCHDTKDGPGAIMVTNTIGPAYYDSIKDIVKGINKFTLPDYGVFVWEKNRRVVWYTIYQNKTVRLSKRLAEILDIPRVIRAGEKHQAVGFSKNRLGPIDVGRSSLYVYSDLAEHQLVGDTSVALLRIVPVEGEVGTNVSRTYKQIQYVPARGGNRPTVEIDIRDDTGRPIPFDGGRVVVILHLRRRRSPYFPG